MLKQFSQDKHKAFQTIKPVFLILNQFTQNLVFRCYMLHAYPISCFIVHPCTERLAQPFSFSCSQNGRYSGTLVDLKRRCIWIGSFSVFLYFMHFLYFNTVCYGHCFVLSFTVFMFVCDELYFGVPMFDSGISLYG